MKTIYLLRHAKSDWSVDGQPDIKRSLNDRGKTDANVLASSMKKCIPFDKTRIVSSPAVRTRETLEPLLKILPEGTKVEWREDLYESGATAYLNAIRKFSNDFDSVLMVGHNPSIQDLIEYLIASSAGSFGVIEVPTGTLACVEIQTANWEYIGSESGTLRWMVHPKLLHSIIG